MKLNEITEWIKKQITRHKNNSGQIDRDPERLPAFMSKRMNLPVGAKEAAEKKIKIDCTVSSYNASIDEIAKALEKLGKVGYTIGEKEGTQKEQPMSNNRRKMKGIPMIRRQQLKRAKRRVEENKNEGRQTENRDYHGQKRKKR